MFKKLTRSSLTALGLLPLALFSEEIRAEQSNEVLRSSRLVAEAMVGKQTAGGNLDLLVPFYGDNTQIWYANLQGFKYGSTYQTYGIGGGYRQVVDNAIYGIYGFFDRQTSVNKINYNRYTAGIERLGETWDFRANLYLYAGSDTTNLVDQGRKRAFIRGNNIVYAHLYEVEKVYKGADFEVGRTLGLDNLRAYLGYYNFGDVIKGPKARLEYQVNPRVALSASAQNDVRGWLTYAGISYWFGKTTLPGATGIESRMLDPIVRDMTVAANTVDSYVTYDIDARNIYFAQPEDPADPASVGAPLADDITPHSLQKALALSKENDIIYLMGGQNPFDITQGIALKPGQTLWSSTQDLSLNGFLVKQGDASKPVNLINGGITVSNGATLNGFSLDGAMPNQTQSGITVDGTSKVEISNVKITGFDHDSASAGIHILGAAPVNLTNVVSDYNGVGLHATAGVINVYGSDNSFQHNRYGSGILIEDSAQLPTLNNATTSHNTGNGVALVGDATFTSTLTKVTSTSNGLNGFNLANANATVNSTTDLVVDGNTGTNLAISAGSMSVVGSGNSFSNSLSGSGIVVSDTGILTRLANATVNSNVPYGISLSGAAVYTATLTNVTSNLNNSTGYYIDAPNVIVDASNLTGDQNDSGGLWINQGKVSVTGTQNSFSNNLEGSAGIRVESSGQLIALQNARVNGNNAGGILINGDSTYQTLFSQVETSNNVGNGTFDGILINNPNVNVTLSNITSNKNSGNGLWVKEGTVQDAGSTKNQFMHNSGSGVLVGTSSSTPSSGRLLSLTNADTSYNGSATTAFDGILLNSNNTTDPVVLTNISSTYNGGNGIWILQPGTVTINNSDFSHNYNVSPPTVYYGGLRIDDVDVTVNLNNVSSNHNLKTGMHVRRGTVNVNGTSDKNTYNGNKSFGIYVSNASSTLNLNNATVDGNASTGIQVEGGTAVIAGSSITRNSFGMVAITEVTGSVAIRNTQITGNTASGILAIGMPISVSNSSEISGNGGESPTYYQIEAQNGAKVDVSGSILIGTIVVSRDGGSITVNGDKYIDVPDVSDIYYCNVTATAGSCVTTPP